MFEFPLIYFKNHRVVCNASSSLTPASFFLFLLPSFVVGREKPDTENSIVALLEADGQMTSSTCSSVGAK